MLSELIVEPRTIEINHVCEAWKNIAPFWPLKNLIASNPLLGLEYLPFEQAIKEGAALFQQSELPEQLYEINRETIKWCQAFFDDGQATIQMPLRACGFYNAFRQLVVFDSHLNKKNITWLKSLPHSAEETIEDCFLKLNILNEQKTQFLTLVLTTLPGWASYVKYRTEWMQGDTTHPYPITQSDYLAMRLVMIYLLWTEAANLIHWYEEASKKLDFSSVQINKIHCAENNYRNPLLYHLSDQAASMKKNASEKIPEAQFIFCIDVRSEPFRRALESGGDYETYGFAGFFGLPIKIEQPDFGKLYASCPVLLTPTQTVKESIVCENNFSLKKDIQGKEKIKLIFRFYQALKYNFTTPFVLVEALGFWSGLWMLLKTISPVFAKSLKQKIIQSIRPELPLSPALNQEGEVNGINFKDQCLYAENTLRMMNLVGNFSHIIVLCGHGSATQNNAYATALDCGACGGHDGASNARIMAEILNNKKVRHELFNRGIHIPDDTLFIGALHNTTTDEVTLFETVNANNILISNQLNKLKIDLDQARNKNNRVRCKKLDFKKNNKNDAIFSKHTKKRSVDWAEMLPEWGLARNASFIVAPRSLTKNINLDGRAFLHSYNWRADKNGKMLTTILTAPMIVAQWINSQYLFSLLDNVAYGSGSKITHNITGKIGVMQGNASDLMHGLPLQSLFSSDKCAYHEPIRLMTVIYAPRIFISRVVDQQENLKTLFCNGWVTLVCIEPDEASVYELQRDLKWQKI
ncbi:MAG: DUF2309 domain-containing protein [Coxiellaceae bacterium]|nr:DUF2309 domain-containing protein [Coxiellaceae bacterium]